MTQRGFDRAKPGVDTDPRTRRAGNADAGQQSVFNQIGIGIPDATATTPLHIQKGHEVNLRVDRIQSTEFGPAIQLHKSRGDTDDLQAVTSGDYCGLIAGFAYVGDTNQFLKGPSIEFLVDGSVSDSGSGNFPGSLRFRTRNSSGGTPTVCWMDAEGKVGIGNVDDPDQQLEVKGSIHISGEEDLGSVSVANGDGGLLYVKSDGKIYWKSNELAETDLTAGGGGGSGDITGVTFETDSGSGSKASDTGGSADFTLLGGSGVDVTNSSATITVAGEDATTSNKGVASFHSDNFAVSSGAVTIKDQGVAYAEIQNVSATDRILGRDSSGAGVIEEITPANLRTMINVADGATATTDTNTTYSVSCVDGDNSDEEKIRLTAGGSGSGTDDVVLEAGTGLSIARSGDKITYTNTVSDTDTDTTYSISCVDGDNSDEEKIRLTAGGSGSGTDDVVLEAGTGLSIARSSDKITFTNTVSDTDTNTTYSVSCVDGDNSDEEKIRLTAGGSGSGTDDVVLEAGTGLSIARSGDKITYTNTVSDTNTWRTVTAGGNTLSVSETLAFTAGTGVAITESAGAVTIASNLEGTELISTGEGGASKFLREDGDGTCSWQTISGGDTTYAISCVDGDNSDEEKIRLTAGGSGSGTDDIVLEAGTGLSIARSSDKITFTNTVSDTNTFRTVTAGGNTLGAGETLAFTAGSNVTITETGGAVTIAASGGGGSGDVEAGSTFTTAGVIMACDGDDKTIDEPNALLTTNGQGMTVSAALATPFQVDSGARDGNSTFKFTTGSGSGTNNQASVQVIAQTAANANVYLGDTDSPSRGGLTYKNNGDSLQLKAAAAVVLELDSAKVVEFKIAEETDSGSDYSYASKVLKIKVNGTDYYLPLYAEAGGGGMGGP